VVNDMYTFVFDEIKLFAEVITSITAAIILIIHFLNICNPKIKRFIKFTLPVFFKGYTDTTGKKIRFFKGLKQKRKSELNIINAISKDIKMEEFLVLDKKALFDIISNSDAFRTITLRSE